MKACCFNGRVSLFHLAISWSRGRIFAETSSPTGRREILAEAETQDSAVLTSKTVKFGSVKFEEFNISPIGMF